MLAFRVVGVKVQRRPQRLPVQYRVQLYYGKKTPGGASGTEPYVTRLDDSKIVLLFGKALIKLHHLFVPSRHTLRVAPSAFA